MAFVCRTLAARRDILDHRQVFEGLRAAGIGVNLHYIPVHLQPYYCDLGFAQGDYPQAERYYAEAISLPMFPSSATRSKSMWLGNCNDYSRSNDA